jgi:hypothetical protein
MTRIAVILCAFLAACDVGDVSGEKPIDAMGSGKMDGSGSGNGCVNSQTPVAAHVHAAGGTTNAGMNCMTSGCHAAGGAGGEFKYAGTAYTQTGGTTPATGVTIRVKFGGTTSTTVTDDAGNFHSTDAITFPATTDITSCPTVTAMVNGLATGQGQCNSCHVPGGTQATIGLQ